MSLSTADRVALTDLVHRYAGCVDDRDVEGVAALFTDDGVLASPAPPHSLDPAHEAVGPAGIRQAMAQLDGLPLTVHAICGVVLDADAGGDPDVARGRVVTTAHHVTERSGEPADLVWHLRYLDSYRRTGQGWRFARRDLHVDLVESRAVARARGIGVAR